MCIECAVAVGVFFPAYPTFRSLTVLAQISSRFGIHTTTKCFVTPLTKKESRTRAKEIRTINYLYLSLSI